MKKIEFLKEPITYFNEAEFVAFISKVEGEDELLNKLSNVLHFPDYFGYNWDALYDCLRDFSWIETKVITMIHTEIPILSKEKLRIYIEILSDAIQDWQEDDKHYLKVIFPKEEDEVIKELMSF